MAELRICCEHGKWEAHSAFDWRRGSWRERDFGWCEGGREPTVEEATQWLKERGHVAPLWSHDWMPEI